MCSEGCVCSEEYVCSEGCAGVVRVCGCSEECAGVVRSMCVVWGVQVW